MNYNYCFCLFESGSKHKSMEGWVSWSFLLLIFCSLKKKNFCRGQDFYFPLKLEEGLTGLMHGKLIWSLIASFTVWIIIIKHIKYVIVPMSVSKILEHKSWRSALHWANKGSVIKGSKWLKGTVVTTNVNEARNSPFKISSAASEWVWVIDIIKVIVEWAAHQPIMQTRPTFWFTWAYSV